MSFKDGIYKDMYCKRSGPEEQGIEMEGRYCANLSSSHQVNRFVISV